MTSEFSPELAASRLDAALEADDLVAFMSQLGEVIKAGGGYTAAARAAGLNRTALYKIASPEGNPALHTLVGLLTPLGLRLSIKTIEQEDGGEHAGVELKSDAFPVLGDQPSLRE